MFLLKIISKRKVNNMEKKILNEYYKDYLKRVSKENIQKYDEEKREKAINSARNEKNKDKK